MIGIEQVDAAGRTAVWPFSAVKTALTSTAKVAAGTAWAIGDGCGVNAAGRTAVSGTKTALKHTAAAAKGTAAAAKGLATDVAEISSIAYHSDINASTRAGVSGTKSATNLTGKVLYGAANVIGDATGINHTGRAVGRALNQKNRVVAGSKKTAKGVKGIATGAAHVTAGAAHMIEKAPGVAAASKLVAKPLNPLAAAIKRERASTQSAKEQEHESNTAARAMYATLCVVCFLFCVGPGKGPLRRPARADMMCSHHPH